MLVFKEYVKRTIEQAKSQGCSHVGLEPPQNFDCVDCEDNAKECNCHDCMGVFCRKCQNVLSVNCEEVRQAYNYVAEYGEPSPA